MWLIKADVCRRCRALCSGIHRTLCLRLRRALYLRLRCPCVRSETAAVILCQKGLRVSGKGFFVYSLSTRERRRSADIFMTLY